MIDVFVFFRVMTPPKNLTEMISFIDLREKIVLEYDDKAKEFILISDNVKVLGNYYSHDRILNKKKKKNK